MQLEKKVDEFRKLNLSQTPRRRLYCRIPIIWSLVKKKPYSVKQSPIWRAYFVFYFVTVCLEICDLHSRTVKLVFHIVMFRKFCHAVFCVHLTFLDTSLPIQGQAFVIANFMLIVPRNTQKTQYYEVYVVVHTFLFLSFIYFAQLEGQHQLS